MHCKAEFFLLASGNPAWAQTTETVPCIKVSVDNGNTCQGKHEAATISWLYCTAPGPGGAHSQKPSTAVVSWLQQPAMTKLLLACRLTPGLHSVTTY